MTTKQQRFADEYSTDMDAAGAAKRAGYPGDLRVYREILVKVLSKHPEARAAVVAALEAETGV